MLPLLALLCSARSRLLVPRIVFAGCGLAAAVCRVAEDGGVPAFVIAAFQVEGSLLGGAWHRLFWIALSWIALIAA